MDFGDSLNLAPLDGRLRYGKPGFSAGASPDLGLLYMNPGILRVLDFMFSTRSKLVTAGALI